jgi:hypothetical protein
MSGGAPKSAAASVMGTSIKQNRIDLFNPVRMVEFSLYDAGGRFGEQAKACST